MYPQPFLIFPASIMTGSSGMHGGGGGGGGINGIKLEGHNSISAAAAGGGGGSAAANYYCNSYTPPELRDVCLTVAKEMLMLWPTEMITILVDDSLPEQQYVEDCQVCCRPIVVNAVVGSDGALTVGVTAENE